MEKKYRLVRKVKFRVLTSHANKMYNVGSRSASVFDVVLLRQKGALQVGRGMVEVVGEPGRLGDSSFSIRIDEPWVTCARYRLGKGACEFMFSSLFLEVCV